jgi:hypothetical protein
MFISTNQTNRKRKGFTKEEDIQLINLIQEYGNSNWDQIASFMKNRNARQCKDRWEGFLSPNIHKRVWTFEEDIFLIQKNREFGTKWKLLSKFFPDQSDTSLKNRFCQIGREKAKTEIKRQQESDKEKKTDGFFAEFGSPEFSVWFEEFSFL